jgi:bacillithiol system protein YtxJ
MHPAVRSAQRTLRRLAHANGHPIDVASRYTIQILRRRSTGRVVHGDLCTLMQWTPLSDPAQLDALDAASQEGPVLIFKHSSRCNISSASLHRLESRWTAEDDARHAPYFLDLLRYRSLSNAVAERYGVEHASPQVLVIHKGRCIHSSTHFGISYADTIQALKA